MSGPPQARQASGRPRWPGTMLFMASSLLLWISVTPYVDLTGPDALDPSAGASNPVYQLVLLSLSALMLVYGLAHPMRRAILQPRLLLAGMLLWFLFVSLLGAHPMLGVKGIVVMTLITANAGIYLLLPASERHFALMIALTAAITLAFAYFGVLFKPQLSIHQASELVEPMNFGLWRGHFNHKNTAAAAMVLTAFIGLYLMATGWRLAGLTIAGLAVLFLVNTGGKTSSAMLPLILVLALVFEKVRPSRPFVVGGLLGFNFLVIGSAIIRPVNDFIASLGIDATFTNRADIWRLAADAIAQRPLMGYGFKGFWQTEELVYSGTDETWAVMAGHGHNSYLDLLLTTGLPGLLLALTWVVFLPLRDISRLDRRQENTPLTRLFIRIWLFALFNAGLESVFFEGRNIVWFMLVVSLCGLRLQSRATLVAETPRRMKLETPAHA